MHRSIVNFSLQILRHGRMTICREQGARCIRKHCLLLSQEWLFPRRASKSTSRLLPVVPSSARIGRFTHNHCVFTFFLIMAWFVQFTTNSIIKNDFKKIYININLKLITNNYQYYTLLQVTKYIAATLICLCSANLY